MNQEDLDEWNKEHEAMDKSKHYAKKNGDKLEELRAKKLFKLMPVTIPNTQENTMSSNLTKQDIEIGSQLINGTIKAKKISTRASFCYFNKK